MDERPASAGDPEGLSIYVHWPFCVARCPYCAFNAHIHRFGLDEGRYAAALVQELQRYVARLPDARVESVFFGGGTPSLMDPRTVAHILEAIDRFWGLDGRVEVTLEANPASTDTVRFSGYQSAGVNRLSLGVQSLRDDGLAALGRLHDVAAAKRALASARRLFPSLSIDLIYARPDQTLAAWRQELEEALTLSADHLSLYQLSFEPGTRFHALRASGCLQPPGEELSRDFFDLTRALCNEAGFMPYEISNYARPGAASRHNLTYWRYGHYIGVGAGAHGRFVQNGKRIATVALSTPKAWLARVEAKGDGLESEEEVQPRDAATEFLLMGLRLAEGVDPARYHHIGGAPLSSSRIAFLKELGLLSQEENGRLIATREGQILLDALMVELLSGSGP